jgi:hypothetical protein
MTTYTLHTRGPASAPTFTIERNGKPFAQGPIDQQQYSQELDAAARLCAYANVSIALSAAVEGVSSIDNQNTFDPVNRDESGR